MKLDIAQNTMYKDFVISNDFDFTKVNVFNCLKFWKMTQLKDD